LKVAPLPCQSTGPERRERRMTLSDADDDGALQMLVLNGSSSFFYASRFPAALWRHAPDMNET